MAEWVTIGSASAVPEGEVMSFGAGSRQVAIANVEGDLHAFDDVCTHQQCSLAEGDLDGTTIECACHGSQFDVTTGEAVNGPAVDPVDVFQMKVEGDELKVLVNDE
jgi:nitrite reductase/ring-hydroxylating ferredoxin subunit